MGKAWPGLSSCRQDLGVHAGHKLHMSWQRRAVSERAGGCEGALGQCDHIGSWCTWHRLCSNHGLAAQGQGDQCVKCGPLGLEL